MRSRVALSLTALVAAAGMIAPAATAGGSEAPAFDDGVDRLLNEPGIEEFGPTCNTQSEVSLARHGSSVVAAWNDGGRCDGLLDQTATDFSISGFGYSGDGGATWKDGGTIDPPSGGIVFGDPVLAADAAGVFYYATLLLVPFDGPPPADCSDRSLRSTIGVARSGDGGRTWSALVEASTGRDPCDVQDKPWLAVDTASVSSGRGNVYVAWSEEDAQSGTVRMLASRSTDSGGSFGVPDVLDPGGGGIGAQIAVGPEGDVYVVWLDGTVLFFARSTDEGKTFAAPTIFLSFDPIGGEKIGGCIPPRVPPRPFEQVLNGDIRVKEWPSLAVDTSGSSDPTSPDFNPYRGRIYVAVPHRDYQPSSDQADVFLVSSSDHGDSWQHVGAAPGQRPTLQVNDDETASDQFHPQVAVGADGTVAVTWYDRRLSPPSNPRGPNWMIDVFAAFSMDGGGTFGDNLRVTDESFPPAQTNPNTNGLSGCYMGEYNGLVADGNDGFFAAWGDNRDGEPGPPDPNVYLDRVGLPPAPPTPTPTTPAPPTPTPPTGGQPPVAPPAGEPPPEEAPEDPPPPEDLVAPSLIEPTGAFQPGRSFEVAWSAGSRRGAATFSVGDEVTFDVDRRVARLRSGFAPWTTWKDDVAATTGTFSGGSGRTYCFRARAVGADGRTSAWSDRRCTAVPTVVSEMTHDADWTRSNGVLRTTRQGAELRLSGISARRLALVVQGCGRCGTIRVFWRGRPLRRLDTGLLRGPSRVPLASFGAVRRGNLRMLVTSAGEPVKVRGIGISRA